MTPVARIGLRVSPGAARTEVVGRHGQGFKVRVAAPPERGRANDAVVELIASRLGIAASRVRVVAGARSRDKVIEVIGMTGEEAERVLANSGPAQ